MVGMPPNPPTNQPQLSEAEVAELLQLLRRKENNWVAWAEACLALQKSGWNANQIFEETGFEPIHQNQLLGAAPVYASILATGVSESVQLHFAHRASDVLYEFRVLSPKERSAAAEFAFSRSMDQLEARDLAKAMKDFSRLSATPEAFTQHPGDILAFYAWQAAKQKSDLTGRSPFIAKGLKYAFTTGAREQVERLMTDFAAKPVQQAPRLPAYRLDSDEELPRVIPVVGEMPLTVADLRSIPTLVPEEPFGLMRFPAAVNCVTIPGWQVIRRAVDPVVLLTKNAALPTPLDGDEDGQVLVIVDRAVRSWTADSYFIVAGENGALSLQWLPEESAGELLGKLLLVMRPKKVLEEGHTQDLYTWDE
jgi:Rubisco Assembly chaperone C-terminal domain/Rubisco accumulation factor 1 alpha helical domain/Rubisco accumulation factor 1 helix turn helix domain